MGRHLLGSVLAGIGVTLGTSVPAQTLDQRDAQSVPATWQRFAQLVQYRLGERLSAGNEPAYRLHLYLQERERPDEAPQSVIVSIWLDHMGNVERVDFPSFGDRQADQDLRTVLSDGPIGEAPPHDMLQPLRLRLSLAWQQ
jgi:hypothetical protein